MQLKKKAQKFWFFFVKTQNMLLVILYGSNTLAHIYVTYLYNVTIFWNELQSYKVLDSTQSHCSVMIPKLYIKIEKLRTTYH